MMVLLGDMDHVNVDSICLEIVLLLAHDRYMVYAERTIGMEIILDAPARTPRLCGSCEI
jgi:hypothetical protein